MTINQNIVSLINARNEEGLTLLYKHYSGALYGMAFRILQNKSFAEDAVQQSFLKIWNNIGLYDEGKSTLFTWMARITKNTSIDIKRLKSFEKETKTETIDVNVHNKKRAHINTEAIDSKMLLEALDEKYAFVLEYLYLRGYSQSELSKEFDIPIGTIKTRVKKGISILRETLKKEKKLFLGMFLLIILLLINIL